MKLKWGNVEVGYIIGLVGQGEGMRLASLAADVPPDQAIVEIGSQGGSSVCWLAMGVHKGGKHAQIYAVDLWDNPELLGREPRHADVAVYERFHAQLAYCASAGFLMLEDVHPIKEESTALAAGWGEPVGLLHVDALHTYEACIADLRAWCPHVAVGGIVVVHDYFDPRYGVRRAVDEYLTPGNGWEIIGKHRWKWRPRWRGQVIARRIR